MKYGRNIPCPCGSGVKYKKCCLAKLEIAKQAHYEKRAQPRKSNKSLAESMAFSTTLAYPPIGNG